jgi:hypothetical protein
VPVGGRAAISRRNFADNPGMLIKGCDKGLLAGGVEIGAGRNISLPT